MEKEQIKQKAIELMNVLDIYKPYINEYRMNDTACLFEQFAGFYVNQYPEIEAKKKAIEEKYDVTVYAITHEYTAFGECYSFLIVDNNDEEANALSEMQSNQFAGYAYVWNKSDDWCSEFGEIVVQSFGGGIRRVA